MVAPQLPGVLAELWPGFLLPALSGAAHSLAMPGRVPVAETVTWIPASLPVSLSLPKTLHQKRHEVSQGQGRQAMGRRRQAVILWPSPGASLPSSPPKMQPGSQEAWGHPGCPQQGWQEEGGWISPVGDRWGRAVSQA